MKDRKILASLCAGLLAVSCGLSACGNGDSSSAAASEAAGSNTSEAGSAAESGSDSKAGEGESQMSDMTALEVCKLMGNGINLGNTMEAYGHKNYKKGETDPTDCENVWGQPGTTK